MSWNQVLFAAEALLVLAFLALNYRPGRAEKALNRIARHRLAPLAVGVFALALRAIVLPIEPIPIPRGDDEFSYLLQADTFAHGRLANPTPHFWEHFETFHVDQFPTYASMYPPLPGLVLAFGQLLFGVPFFGVWLSVGIMCATLCWALRGWFPPGWAFLAAVIAAIRLGTFSYWADSYWGGALAATGGALVFGALPRLLRASRRRDALLAALGMVVLANTRPYEGSVFSVAAGLVALWYVRKLRLRRIVQVMCAVLVCAGALMAYYNWRVFGSPTTLPYAINRQTYAVAPVYLFQHPGPPKVYRHKEMRDVFMGWEMGIFERARTRAGFLAVCVAKVYWVWSFFVAPALTLPLLAFPGTWRSWRTRILLFMVVPVALANLLVPFFQPHYLAPATVVFYAMVLQGMRALNRTMPRAVRAIPLVCIAMIGVRVGLTASMLPDDVASPTKTWAGTSHAFRGRVDIIHRLLAEGGKHLIVVHYGPRHVLGEDWVHNAADMDAAPILWARDMGPEKNAELIRSVPARKAWWLEVDKDAKLSPFSEPGP
ncbi:MAG TPA: hypothetical protein VMB03_05765 [Bryobacteraceae bacterium]|nr:hypothetical protein [Bryobacteraceae bacterium]